MGNGVASVVSLTRPASVARSPSFAITSGEGGFSVRLSRISASRPFAIPRRSTTDWAGAVSRSAASARRTCSPEAYGSRPIVSQMAARTDESDSALRRATSVSVTVSIVRPPTPRAAKVERATADRSGGGCFHPCAAWPIALAASARISGNMAFSAGTMLAMSGGRSRRPSARSAIRRVWSSGLPSPARITARSRAVGARRSSASRIAIHLGPADVGEDRGCAPARAATTSSAIASDKRCPIIALPPQLAGSRRVLEHLLGEILRVRDRHVGDPARRVFRHFELWHHECRIGR